MAKREEPVPSYGLAAMAVAVRPSIDAYSEGLRAWLADAGRIQTESLRFVGDRFRKDAKWSADLAACRRPKEVVALQTEGVRELVSDYLHEGAAIASLFAAAYRHGIDSAFKVSASRPAR